MTLLGTWYTDADADGYGDPGMPVADEDQPSGTVTDATDCDDADGSIHPGAAETCDGVDQDCDGLIDDDPVDAFDWHSDDDGDGYGSVPVAAQACNTPSGTVADATDCDDDDAEVSPGAEERCNNGIDDDCAGDGDLHCRPEGVQSLSDVALKCASYVKGDELGVAMDMHGDMDGDGFADVVISAAAGFPDSTGPGGLHVISGHAMRAADVADLSSKVSLYERSWGSGVGVAILDDQDHDGLPELAFGALAPDDDSCAGVMIFDGPLDADADCTGYNGVVRDSVLPVHIGSSVTSVSDTNGDGVGELLTGGVGDQYHPTTGWDIEAGSAWLVAGPITGERSITDAAASFIHGPYLEYTWLGASACASDHDGDGVVDYAISAPSPPVEAHAAWIDAGVTYLIDGPVTGEQLLADTYGNQVAADGRIDGTAALPHGGSQLGCGGDVDGDGLDDLLVVSYWGAHIAVYTSIPSTVTDVSAATWTLDATDGWVGWAATIDSDLDADGKFEIAAPAGNFTDLRGAVGIWYGPASGTVSLSDADAVFDGEAEGDQVGAVAGGGDVDGDGYDDLLIGAPYQSDIAEDAGAVYLIWGGVDS